MEVIIVHFSVLVSFDPTSYTVTEGEDASAVLTLVRSGANLNRQTSVIVVPSSGTANGVFFSISQLFSLFASLFLSSIRFQYGNLRCDLYSWSNNGHC